MKLVVGLGNPGEKYKITRHNVGFLVLDELKNRIANFQSPIINQEINFQFKKNLKSEIINLKSIIIAKPQTFMNDSGVAVSKVQNFYSLSPNELYIIHDDLDIKLGGYKIQFGKGPKVHNGINSIEEALGTQDFWRVRVGIENREEGKGKREKGEEYVLQNFTGDELIILKDVIEKIVADLVKII